MSLCDRAAAAASLAIAGMVGSPESGLMLEMGADGTPTKSIDKAAENAIISELERSGTGFRVLSEEVGDILVGDDPQYFINLDPLDGTFNAVHAIPFYSVSIYLSRDGFSLAYICDLASGAKYYAEKGRGAFKEPGGRLSVSKTSDFRDYSISAYTVRPHTARIVAVGDRVRRIRTLGSTSLEMSLVAEGRLDAFVDLRGMLRVVDVAAGKLILEEAGGLITDAAGKELHLDGNMWQRTDLIGSNRQLHQELLELIGGISH